MAVRNPKWNPRLIAIASSETNLRSASVSPVSFSFKTKILISVLVSNALPLFAQNGAIQGRIVDPASAVIANCPVQAVDDAKAVVVRKTMSGSDGAFQLQPLPPGTYTVKVEAPGMKKTQRTGVVLDVNQVLNLGDIRMEVGAISESVTVSAE